jgi:hypothetical protein
MCAELGDFLNDTRRKKHFGSYLEVEPQLFEDGTQDFSMNTIWSLVLAFSELHLL